MNALKRKVAADLQDQLQSPMDVHTNILEDTDLVEFVPAHRTTGGICIIRVDVTC